MVKGSTSCVGLQTLSLLQATSLSQLLTRLTAAVAAIRFVKDSTRIVKYRQVQEHFEYRCYS